MARLDTEVAGPGVDTHRLDSFDGKGHLGTLEEARLDTHLGASRRHRSDDVSDDGVTFCKLCKVLVHLDKYNLSEGGRRKQSTKQS